MTTLAMERGLPFPTTFGFKTTSGFQIASASAAVRDSCSACSAAPIDQLSLHDNEQLLQQPERREPVTVSPTPSVKVPPTPDASESSGHVGWRGLLEISEQACSSGVLGAKALMEEADAGKDVQLELCCTAHTNAAIRRLLKSVVRGLKACQEPEKALDGMGGTYFFSNDAGKKAAILKPCDEEPLAPNNPKGYVGRALGDPGWKPTVRVGEAAMREVAAYLLDHDNWARVPTSVLVRARHPIFCYNTTAHMRSASSQQRERGSSMDLAGLSDAVGGSDADDELFASPSKPRQLPSKLGSLQEFVQHECDTSEMGPSRFSARDVHRIGILDIRIFNTDRHAGNMLVRMPRASAVDLKSRMADTQYELIPIDHGFCLPETLEAPYFEWLHWPQALKPFTDDELQYIADLDIEKDKAILRQEIPNLRPECHRVLEVSTLLLQLCAAAGLTLYEIANVMTRPFVDNDDEPSELEKIAVHAKQCAQFRAAQRLEEEEEEEDGSSDSEPEFGCGDVRGGHGFTRFAPIREDDPEVMLFDLEGVSAAASAKRAAAAGQRQLTLEPSSPSRTPSPGSSPSSSSVEEHLSVDGSSGGTTPRAGAGGFGYGVAAGVSPAAQRLQQPVAMARSLHTDAFAWRKSRQQQQAIKVKTSGKRATPQAYPPPVVTFAPGSLDGFFSDFSEQLWSDFVAELRREIEEALVEGKWRAATSRDAPIAMSCPRF